MEQGCGNFTEFDAGDAVTVDDFQSGDVVTNLAPPPLLQKQTYMIFSQTKYLFTPAVDFGNLMGGGVTLSDFAYSAPRQATCVVYNNAPVLVAGLCPQS